MKCFIIRIINSINPKKFPAFTMVEALVVMILVGIIAIIMLGTLKNSNLQQSALEKAGMNMYSQLSFAVQNIIAKRSKEYNMTSLIALDDTEFSIADSGADEKLLALLESVLISPKTPTLSSSYTDLTLTDDSNTEYESDGFSGKIKVSDFPQITLLKNKTILGIHLHENCTTTDTAIFDPSAMYNKTRTNSCGMIFFDVNGENIPNKLGIDQYIVSIGKAGIK